MEKFNLKQFIAENKATFYSSLNENESTYEGKKSKEYYKDAEADDAEHIDALEKDMKDDKKASKMKVSELKSKIKEMIVAEYEKDVDYTDENPEKEVDFLSEIEAMLDEAEGIVAAYAKNKTIKEALDFPRDAVQALADAYKNIEKIYSTFGRDSRFKDEAKQDDYLMIKAILESINNKLLGRDSDFRYGKGAELGYDGLNEAEETEKDTAETDTEETTTDTETTDVETKAEVNPDVKAVQDALTQAQVAAQKLGDKKLTDQIGNTITFFTREHVVEKPKSAEAVAEELTESIFPILKKILK